MKKVLRNKQGFTMIELIVVIVIIGILAAIAIPKYLDLRANAERAAWDGMLGSLRAAASMAYANSVVQNPPATMTVALVNAQMLDKGTLAGTGPWTNTFGSGRVCTATYVAPASITGACAPVFPAGT